MTAILERPSAAATARTLDATQLAHLRHFNNLSRLPVNDWSLMGSRSTGQDDFTSYRYQLAYMIYGAAVGGLRAPARKGGWRIEVDGALAGNAGGRLTIGDGGVVLGLADETVHRLVVTPLT